MKLRNCAWLTKEDQQTRPRAVWTRGRIVTTQCPKSIITAESLQFLEMYRVWKRLGGGCVMSLEAKTAEAIELLEQEWIAEKERENQQ